MTSNALMCGCQHTNTDDGALPLLSFCLCNRNDDYAPDLLYRLSTTINYMARNASLIGSPDAIELVVTDYGSDTPLSESVCLTIEGSALTRFVHVPSHMLGEKNQNSGFDIGTAANVSVRYALGRFVAIMAADVVMPALSLCTLLQVLQGTIFADIDVENCYLLIPRRHIPHQVVTRRPSVETLDRFLLLSASSTKESQDYFPGISCGAGILVLNRRRYDEVIGQTEGWNGWGFHDIDFGLRCTEMWPWIDLSSLGVISYHMEHQPVGGRKRRVHWTAQNPHRYSPMATFPQQGGLAGHCFAIQRAVSTQPSEQPGVPQRGIQNSCVSSDRGGIAVGECGVSHVIESVGDSVAKMAKYFMEDWLLWDQSVLLRYCDALHMLGAYCSVMNPQRYLEIGIASAYAVVLAACLHPAMEVYGIDMWQGELYAHAPFSLARALREYAKHCGYQRLVNGDCTTGIDRLQNSFIGEFWFDIALVNGNLLGDVCISQCQKILKILAPDGVFLFVSGEAEHAASVLHALAEGNPDLGCVVSVDGKTFGMTSLLLGDRAEAAVMRQAFQYNSGPVRRIVRSRQHREAVNRVKYAVIHPTLYPRYIKKAINKALANTHA